MAIGDRRALWARIATDLRPAGLDDARLGITEVDLDGLEPALDAILAGRARGRGRSASDSADIRAWAKENGYEVSERGRISAEVRAAYNDAK